MKGRKHLYLLIVVFLVALVSWLMIRKANVDHGNQVVQTSDSTSTDMLTQAGDTGPLKEPETAVEVDPETSDDEVISKTAVNLWTVNPKKTGYYRMPIDGVIELSGSFGELRPNHFHAGLDIRTGGQQGMKVYAAADGYVSRIKVSPYGYGKALYIQHPNGTTTVYGHLQKFAGAIEEAVIARQYKSESFEIDYYPGVGMLRVKKGDVVAYSGNTGGSGGPHLHFEIRNSKGEASNPLIQGIELEDKIAPSFRGAQVLKLDKEIRKSTGGLPYISLQNSTSKVVLDPGRYGIAASWLEYFTDRMNYLGVNYAALIVDGKPVFTQEIESFAFPDSRYINHHINYEYYIQRGKRYTKFFKDEGNGLPFYKGNGAINLKANDTLNITLLIRDIAGQMDSFTFSMIGVQGANARFLGYPESRGAVVNAARGATLNTRSARVIIPAGALYVNQAIEVSESEGKPELASNMIHVHKPSTPLHKSIRVQIEPKAKYSGRLNKLVVMQYDRGSRNSSPHESKVVNGKVEASLKYFGIYYLRLDTIPPTVKFNSSGRTLTAYVSDSKGDIAYYRGTVDGKWVLFEFEPKLGRLRAQVPEMFEKGEHKLELLVSDLVGNETKIEKTVLF